MKPWYDNPESITTRIERDGLSALYELYRERKDAGYERGERMAEWVVLGRYLLDACGNIAIIDEYAPEDILSYRCPVVMSREESSKVSDLWSATFGSPAWPGDECSRCGNGWDIRNAHEVWRGYDVKQILHTRCRELEILQNTTRALNEILDRSEIVTLERRLIPSQYSDDLLHCGPWMDVLTPEGTMRIGPRKRVYSIHWSETGIKVPPETFAAEKVTVGDGYVHAYGVDKAVEYLRTIWAHAPKGAT